jgi:hypothetical protein
VQRTVQVKPNEWEEDFLAASKSCRTPQVQAEAIEAWHGVQVTDLADSLRQHGVRACTRKVAQTKKKKKQLRKIE